MSWIKNSTWLNDKSYITIDELFNEQIEVINKLSKVLFEDAYFEDTKVFCRSVLEFAIDHEFITWKQAYAILNILTTKERLRLYHQKPVKYRTKYIYAKSSISDYEHDRFCEMLFGDSTRAEELEGYVKCYREDGSRYFALPTFEDIEGF